MKFPSQAVSYRSQRHTARPDSDSQPDLEVMHGAIIITHPVLHFDPSQQHMYTRPYTCMQTNQAAKQSHGPRTTYTTHPYEKNFTSILRHVLLRRHLHCRMPFVNAVAKPVLCIPPSHSHPAITVANREC